MKAENRGEPAELAKRAKSWTANSRRRLALLTYDVRRSSLPAFFGAFAAAVAVAALAVFAAERGRGGMFERLFDGVWWAIVTIATVGYGDKYPVTDTGRVFAILLMVAGIVLTALISGAVASIFVDRRIREGKGLQEIRVKNHLIVCGWNPDAESLLKGLESQAESASRPLVLANWLEVEAFDALKARFPGLDLRFVRGDFTQESVLKRAAAKAARSCLFVPDASGGNSTSNADERTILGCLAFRSLNPEATVSAEILRPESEQHLRRAAVENVVVNGELAGYILSAGSVSKGLPRAARSLLSAGEGPRLRESAFPPALVGKSFAEASSWFLQNGKGVLVGLLSEEKGVSLHDLLSDDSSAIDAFIRRKFSEAEIDLEAQMKAGSELKLAPGPDYLIREGDSAFVVA